MKTNKFREIVTARLSHLNDTADPNYKLGYETALNDIIRDLNGTIQRQVENKMTKLGERNFLLLSQAINDTGSYDPNEIFPYFEERLYIHEADTIWAFLQWIIDGKTTKIYGCTMPKRAFGRANYEERFQEFLNDTK